MRQATPLKKQMAIINLYVQLKRAGCKMLQFEMEVARGLGVCKTTAYEIIRRAKIEGIILNGVKRSKSV